VEGNLKSTDAGVGQLVNCDHLWASRNVIVVSKAAPYGIKGGGLMLWTFFMLFMFAWMLGLVLEFHLGAIPFVIVLTTILAFIKLDSSGLFSIEAAGRDPKVHPKG
jgi:hypothetical protein